MSADWLEDFAGRVLPVLIDALGSTAAHEPRPGDRIGSYRLSSELGRGGMGVVFQAHDERLDRPVALKFLNPHFGHADGSLDALLAEARAAARLDHPAIAAVHDVGETEDGRAYIVMAHCEGETLEALIGRGPVPIGNVIDIGCQLADALAAAHRAAILHRDVKPSNVMLAPHGRVRLIDFGVAARSGLPAASSPRGGTLPYMSPERLAGEEADAKADLWSLGVVLYEMLAGRRPFSGATAQAVVAAIQSCGREPPPAIPAVPAELLAVVQRCLAANPEDRYRSAEALRAALLDASPEWPGRPEPAGAVSDPARVREHYRRGRHLLSGGDPASVRRARDAFLTALRADPGHAPAWAGLSDAYELMAYLAILPPDEAHLRARAAAERALQLEPDLAEAHVSLATVLLDYYRHREAAERHYRRALSLQPDNATAHQLFAEFLRDQGRFEQAITEIDEAIRLDPLSPYHRLVRGIVLHMARRHDEAMQEFEGLLAATPDYPMAHFYIALTCASSDRPDRALHALDVVDPDHTFPDAISMRGAVHARAGREAEARAALRLLHRKGGKHHVLPFHEALVRAGLGEMDAALTLLEEDVEQRTWFNRVLGVEPLLDPLRDHPRFRALLERVRFPVDQGRT